MSITTTTNVIVVNVSLYQRNHLYHRNYPFVSDPLAPNEDWAASMSSDWVFQTTSFEIHLRTMLMVMKMWDIRLIIKAMMTMMLMKKMTMMRKMLQMNLTQMAASPLFAAIWLPVRGKEVAPPASTEER